MRWLLLFTSAVGATVLFLVYRYLYSSSNANEGKSSGGVKVIKVQQAQQQAQQKQGDCHVQRIGNEFSMVGKWQHTQEQDPAWQTTARVDALACASKTSPFGNRPKMFQKGQGLHGCCFEHGCCDLPQNQSDILLCPNYAQIATQTETPQTTSPIQRFLHLNQRRTILVLGDSIAAQIFAAIQMELRAHQIQHNATETTLFVTPFNVTVQLYYFYVLSNVNHTEWNVKMDGAATDNRIIPVMQKPDIIIANMGLHNSHFPEFQYRSLKHLQNIALAERTRRRDNALPPQCFIWRRTSVQHYPAPHGCGVYQDNIGEVKHCWALTSSWNHVSDQSLDRVLNEAQNVTPPIAVMNMTSIFAPAHALHSRRWDRPDCTHYCYSTRLYGPVMELITQTIQQACQFL